MITSPSRGREFAALSSAARSGAGRPLVMMIREMRTGAKLRAGSTDYGGTSADFTPATWHVSRVQSLPVVLRRDCSEFEAGGTVGEFAAIGTAVARRCLSRARPHPATEPG